MVIVTDDVAEFLVLNLDLENYFGTISFGRVSKLPNQLGTLNKNGYATIKNHGHAFTILKGRILHVSHVKGAEDLAYLKLAKDFNTMVEKISS